MNDRKLQEKARDLIGREVCYSASHLVAALFKDWDAAHKMGVGEDDLYTLASRRADVADYQDNAPSGLQVRPDADTFKWKMGNGTWSAPFDTHLEAISDAFDALGLDEPDGSEAFEHWIVSDWLAEKLAAKGESIVRDMLGFTIWARCTTGQAIYIDGVIEDIVSELHRDDPEPAEPAPARYSADGVHVGGFYRDGVLMGTVRGDDIEAPAIARHVADALNRAER